MRVTCCALARVDIVSLAAGVCLFLAGCNRGPTAVQLPEFDPVEASEQAIALYDANHDGVLSEQELAQCPGIRLNRQIYDADGSGTISRQEIENRLRDLRTAGIGLTKLRIQVRLNGRPLSGAEVKLVPEAYLGPNVKTAWGKVNSRGSAVMHVRNEDLPDSEKGILGVHYGTYKIEITHPTVSVPTKYNAQTTLGYETQRGNPNYSLDLSTRQ